MLHAPDPASANPQKSRHGLQRMAHAFKFSLSGLTYAWQEAAFRQEALAALVLVPLSFWLGNNWVEVVLLAGSCILVMVVELLNTAIESVIDRIGSDWHALSKRAKDLGSAAVLMTLLLCLGIWSSVIYQRWLA